MTQRYQSRGKNQLLAFLPAQDSVPSLIHLYFWHQFVFRYLVFHLPQLFCCRSSLCHRTVPRKRQIHVLKAKYINLINWDMKEHRKWWRRPQRPVQTGRKNIFVFSSTVLVFTMSQQGAALQSYNNELVKCMFHISGCVWFEQCRSRI